MASEIPSQGKLFWLVLAPGSYFSLVVFLILFDILKLKQVEHFEISKFIKIIHGFEIFDHK